MAQCSIHRNIYQNVLVNDEGHSSARPFSARPHSARPKARTKSNSARPSSAMPSSSARPIRPISARPKSAAASSSHRTVNLQNNLKSQVRKQGKVKSPTNAGKVSAAMPQFTEQLPVSSYDNNSPSENNNNDNEAEVNKWTASEKRELADLIESNSTVESKIEADAAAADEGSTNAKLGSAADAAVNEDAVHASQNTRPKRPATAARKKKKKKKGHSVRKTQAKREARKAREEARHHAKHPREWDSCVTARAK